MILCRRCGVRLTRVYGDEQFHPLCDPDPHTWTAAQLLEWSTRAVARRRAEQQRESQQSER